MQRTHGLAGRVAKSVARDEANTIEADEPLVRAHPEKAAAVLRERPDGADETIFPTPRCERVVGQDVAEIDRAERRGRDSCGEKAEQREAEALQLHGVVTEKRITRML